MSARAGLEDDASRYDEMRMLARQLWKYLSTNDMGLVLRVRGGGSPPDVDSKGGVWEEAPNHSLGYHSSTGEQLFLLICEEAVEKPRPQAMVDLESDRLNPSKALQVAS